MFQVSKWSVKRKLFISSVFLCVVVALIVGLFVQPLSSTQKQMPRFWARGTLFVSTDTSFHSHSRNSFFHYLKTLQQTVQYLTLNTTLNTTHSVGSRRLAVFYGVVGEFLSPNGGKLHEKERGRFEFRLSNIQFSGIRVLRCV